MTLPRHDPRVSIILPTFNQEQWLPRALAGVLDQTFGDFELIVVNDGSTDGTERLLADVEDPRVRVIHQRNSRLPRALNRGFVEARGEYATWISSDNVCAPIMIEALVAALDAHPDAVFAASAFAWIDEDDRVTRVTRDQDLTSRGMLARNPGIAAFMYRREVHDAVGFYDPTLEGAEDWDMWQRILDLGPAVYVSNVLYYYREHKASMTAAIPDTVARASRDVFMRAIIKRTNDFNIEEFYPAVLHCKDRRAAVRDACMDLAWRCLASPFADPAVASKLLDRAEVEGAAGAELRAYRAALAAREDGRPGGATPSAPPPARTGEVFSREYRRVFTLDRGAAAMPPCARPPEAMSFCIITAGRRPELLGRVIASIRSQGMPVYEIIVAGCCPRLPGIIAIDMPEAAGSGRLGALRNAAVLRARFPWIVILDDDVLLAPDWFEAFRRAAPADVITSEVRVPDGGRYWDHADLEAPFGHGLLAAHEHGVRSYMSGGTGWVMARRVAEAVHWDGERGFYMNEDVDFSDRCRAAGFDISHDGRMTVFHADPSYTQIGRHVMRRDEPVVDLFAAHLWSSASEILTAASRQLDAGRVTACFDLLRFGECKFPDVVAFADLRRKNEAARGGRLPGTRFSAFGDAAYHAAMKAAADLRSLASPVARRSISAPEHVAIG